MFDTYRRLTKGRKDAVYGALDEAYQTLMTDGVKPLFALLSKGDMAGYHDLLSTTTSIQEDFFYQALGAVHAHQKQLINQAEADEQLRSEEHTSELQSLMRISYAVFCLKKQKN